MKLIATYARVSTSNQEKQETIKNQMAAFYDYAAKNDCKIVREYKDDGWSGSILERPDLDRLREDAKRGIFEAVLILDLDRLSRNYIHQGIIMEELEKRGIEMIFITMPTPKNDEEKMFCGMRGLLATYEKIKIADRFRRGKVRITKVEGKVMTSQAPYGYKYIPNKKIGEQIVERGHYEIIPEEAETIRNIFNWVDKENLSLRGVIKRLKELGIKPRKSNRKVWNNSTLSTLIRNRTLMGKAYWGRTYAVEPINPIKKDKYRKMEKSSRRNKPMDEWIAKEIEVPAIIEEVLFNRVGKRLRENFAKLNHQRKNEYLLGGKISCICGKPRGGEGPQHGKHLYYRCSDRVYSFPLPPTCHEKGINARIADKLLWIKLVEMLKNPELLAQQIDRWTQKCKRNEKLPIFDTEELKSNVTRLRIEENRYSKAFGAGYFSLEDLKKYRDPVLEQITELEAKIRENEERAASVKTLPVVTMDEIKEFSNSVGEVLDGLKFPEKRAIIIGSILKIISSQKELNVAGFAPLDINYYKYVELWSKCGHRGPAQRGQIHIIQSHHQKTG